MVIMILNFRFSQRRLFDRRPHHGLGASVKRAVHQKLLEFLGDDAFGVMGHCQVRIGPVAGHAETLELVPLDVDPAFSEAAALLAKLDHVDRVLVASVLAILLLDLPLDREAMAVPAGDIARVLAHHLLGADHHVLQDLVQRVADMQMPVRVGRAIVERELRATRLAAKPVIDTDPLPSLQPARLAPRQSRPHREIRFGKVQCVLVVWCVGTHRSESLKGGCSGEGESRHVFPGGSPVRAPGT